MMMSDFSKHPKNTIKTRSMKLLLPWYTHLKIMTSENFHKLRSTFLASGGPSRHRPWNRMSKN